MKLRNKYENRANCATCSRALNSQQKLSGFCCVECREIEERVVKMFKAENYGSRNRTGVKLAIEGLYLKDAAFRGLVDTITEPDRVIAGYSFFFNLRKRMEGKKYEGAAIDWAKFRLLMKSQVTFVRIAKMLGTTPEDLKRRFFDEGKNVIEENGKKAALISLSQYRDYLRSKDKVNVLQSRAKTPIVYDHIDKIILTQEGRNVLGDAKHKLAEEVRKAYRLELLTYTGRPQDFINLFNELGLKWFDQYGLKLRPGK